MIRVLRARGVSILVLFLLVSLALTHTGCQAPAGTSQDEGGGVLVFKSGFEDGVVVSDDIQRLTGGDHDGFDWSSIDGWRNSSFVYIVSRDRDPSEFMGTVIEKVKGPEGDSTRALRLINKADDPDHGATSRNEFSLFGNQSPDDFKEGYVRYWMKLEERLPSLVRYDEPSPFYMIMEWKEPNSRIRNSAAECAEIGAAAGGTNNYRINLNINKDSNDHRFFWRVRAEHPQPCRKEEWRHENREIEVPFGKWFLLEAYMKKDSVDGRVYFAVDGQVILDTDKTRPDGFTGRTEHPDNPLPLHFWSPMKNYHHMDWNREGPVSQWYDNFELWTSFPPEHAESKFSSE